MIGRAILPNLGVVEDFCTERTNHLDAPGSFVAESRLKPKKKTERRSNSNVLWLNKKA